jgi:hypothetical protein
VGAPKGTALAQLILKRNRTVVDVGGVIYGDGLLDRDTESALVGDYFYNFGKFDRDILSIWEGSEALDRDLFYNIDKFS